MNEQSKQWMTSNEHAPKKAKTVQSYWKDYGHSFLGLKGHKSSEYLEKRKTITRQYFADLLDRLMQN